MRMKRSPLAVTAALAVAVAGGTAFTAGNTGTPDTSVGQASTVTTGFTVANVEYTLDALSIGDHLASVSFTLEAEAGANVANKARVRLVAGADYYECVTGTPVGQVVGFTCDLTTVAVTANAVDTLDIVGVSDHSA